MLRLVLFGVVLVLFGANGKETEEDLRKVHLEGLGNVIGSKFWDGEFYEFFGISYATVPKGRDRFKVSCRKFCLERRKAVLKPYRLTYLMFGSGFMEFEMPLLNVIETRRVDDSI